MKISIKKIKEKLKSMASGIVLSFALSFMLCIFAPYELYFTNQSEFWFGADTMLSPALLCFALMFSVIAILLAVVHGISKTAYRISLGIGAAAFVYLYVQGNFFVSGLPSLDGTEHDWSAASPERVKSIVAIVFCLAVFISLIFFVKGELYAKIVAFVSGGVSLMLVMTLVTLVLTTPLVDKSQKLKVYTTGEFEYSSEENFIIFVLDALDAEAFEEGLSRNPEYADTFDDFTYFTNALAAYPFTMHSVPMILTGEWHENEISFDEYVQKGLDSSTLINKLEERDYRIGIYEPSVLSISAENEGRFENLVSDKDRYSSLAEFSGVIFKMSGLKYAPWDLKQYCYDVSEYSESLKLSVSDESGHFGWSNESFYSAVTKDGAVKSVDGRTFRYIHVEGAHVPFKYDKDMNIIEGGTYEDNVDACLTMCDRYIEELKKSGVYDNSVIVIMGDHGFAAEDMQHMLEDRMNPALLIKGRGESADSMRTSSAPISYEDLADAFALLADGKGTLEVFKYKDGDTRERRFIKYYYACEDTMEEFIVYGRARDIESMRPTGVVYNLGK